MIDTDFHRVEFADGEELAKGLADWTAERLRAAIAARGVALLVVSGGKSPARFFEILSNVDLDWTRVAILNVTDPLPWPHLKVVTVDGRAAYIGSANITGPGLVGRNLELGVLVRGQQVEAIERTLDLIPVDRRDLSGSAG